MADRPHALFGVRKGVALVRVFCGALVHETNSFSPIPTSRASFEEHFHRPMSGKSAEGVLEGPEGQLVAAARARGHEVLVGLHCAAAPSAPPSARVYESLRDDLLADLHSSLPVDAVLLFLHGAQSADGYDDCEGDLLGRVRSLVGPRTPIGVELDLHANITGAMIGSASFIAACMEYPHTDFAERALHVVQMLEDIAAGRVRPTVSFARAPMLGFFHTTRDPMRAFVDRVMAMEGQGALLSVSLAHGFPFADIAATGAGVLVTTNGAPEEAERVANDLAREFFALRNAVKAPALSIEEALDSALAAPAGPVVIADTSDNAGGGAANDSTFILRALLERGVQGVVVGALWDPVSVRFAQMAGVGAYLPLRIGGKIGPQSGLPVDVRVRVLAVTEDLVQQAFGAPSSLGPAALVETAGVKIVLASKREQTHSVDCFGGLGVDLAQERIVVVKSAQHFYASFAAHTARVLYASPPGSTSTHFDRLPYKKITRPIWPLDEFTG